MSGRFPTQSDSGANQVIVSSFSDGFDQFWAIIKRFMEIQEDEGFRLQR